ncbi:MAG TPA: cation:proton antiporter, partial [Polyangiaceae bacterium]|nr:cation:proton antiporter [Polyangiaceae bacterium]
MPHWELTPLTLLLAQIGAILVVSRLLGQVAKRLGQPLVIAEVVAGIVLGPSLLGWLSPELMVALFPKTSLPSLALLSQVGLVIFMFLIGLELDPKILAGRTHTSVLISHTSIAVPFALGALAAVWIYGEYSSPDVNYLSFWLFLGAAMSVTAFPVLARILSERNLLSSQVGTIAIACAAVDDVTAWCLLSFVVAVTRADGLVGAAWTTVLAVSFILLMLLVVRPFLRRLGQRLGKEELSHTVVAFILFLLVLSASITEVIGIHALFGAFLFGAILPKDNGLAERLIHRLETVAVVLLLPLFFAYSGLRTQIGLVNTPRDWMITAAIIGLATLGKFGGSMLAGRYTGLRWREASAIGILMNTRGLMELIVLNLGLDLGVLSPTVFTMMVIMALVTTVATTPVLNWVYPDSELQKQLATDTNAGLEQRTPVFGILLCVADGTAGAAMARAAAALVGWRRKSSELHALHLTKPAARLSEDLRRQNSPDGPSPLGPVLEVAREMELKVRPLSFVSTDIAEDICRTAEAKRSSLVLLGLHRPL